jgi:tRNA (adenine37-N6)-methyltransferase
MPGARAATLRGPRSGSPNGPRTAPNRLGLSTCELLGVEDRTIHVQDLDAVDGTPVLDVKPYLQEFAPRGSIRRAAWSTELMANYF